MEKLFALSKDSHVKMIYTIGFKRKNMIKATIKDVVSYCKRKSVLGLDTETTGLDPHNNKIIMLQIGDDKNQFVIDVRKLL